MTSLAVYTSSWSAVYCTPLNIQLILLCVNTMQGYLYQYSHIYTTVGFHVTTAIHITASWSPLIQQLGGLEQCE